MDSQIIEESREDGEAGSVPGRSEDSYEGDGMLGESAWETSPGKGLSRENSAANAEELDEGVLGLLYQLRQTQHNRRGGVV